jgi:hypothetical protein
MNRIGLETRIEKIIGKRNYPRVKNIFKRYIVAEVVGTVSAYVGYITIEKLTKDPIFAAYAGSIGENVGYYGTLITHDVTHDLKKAREEGMHYGIKGVSKTLKNLYIEFALAEALDSTIVRPATMGLSVKYLGEGAGVITGKLTADALYFGVAQSTRSAVKYFSNKTKDIKNSIP